MRIVVVEDNEVYRNELINCLEQEEQDIMPIYEAVLKAAPDYDMDYILSLLEEQ